MSQSGCNVSHCLLGVYSMLFIVCTIEISCYELNKATLKLTLISIHFMPFIDEMNIPRATNSEYPAGVVVPNCE